ncbi:MAG: NTP transferase domain-containing protein [Calditrichae bacterium]|nr:NTP transferase domain-containing protein [Calditrichia bacterium]
MLNPNIDALIISAGYSSRMKDFKPLMLFEGFPFIISVICKTSQICQNLYVVTGYRDKDIRDEVRRWLDKQPEQQALKFVNLSEDQWKMLHSKVNFIHNEQYKLGMFSSLKIGLKHIGKTDWILYHFVDQPHIPADFYTLFKKQLDNQYHWIQPRYQKKNAHPILIRNDLGNELAKADLTSDLKSFSKNRNIKKKFWNCDYPQVLSDFDTPDNFYSPGEAYGHL